jgi:hypothetical protein
MMQGILQQIKQSHDKVNFAVLAEYPPEENTSIEYVLLKIEGSGSFMARKLLPGELISDFSTSNLLFTDAMVYILPEWPGKPSCFSRISKTG